MSSKICVFFAVLGLFVSADRANAGVMSAYADVVIEFFDSGNGTLPGGGPQGGVFPPPATNPTAVSLDVVLGGDPDVPTLSDPADYLSLPDGSFVTVGFTNFIINDGPGDDIFISEVGAANEFADIFVSSVFSTDPNDFTFIGRANGNTISGFDLSSINFSGDVRAVKVVGLGLGGAPGAPGFDLANVEALNFSPASVVPEPNSLGIFAFGGLALVGSRSRRRISKS